MTWRNWSGSVECSPTVVKPSSVGEIAETVTEADELRVAGSGHSFSPLVETHDTLVSLDDYTGVVSVDEQEHTATVRAGTTLAELNNTLARHGLALENLGDIDRQTVAGALSTGTHGTGEFQILAAQAMEIELVDGNGERHQFSEGDDFFGAAQVSLGALGVVTGVELDLVPSYGLELVREKRDLNTVLSNLRRDVEENRNFEFFWFPETRTGVTKRMNEVGSSERSEVGSDGTLENLSWKAVCEASRFVPSKYASRLAARTIREERLSGPSHEVFASPREVRFNETEYGVPVEDAPEVFREIAGVVEGFDVAFPVEVRYVEGDDIPLSPAYGRDSVFIAVHTYHKKPYRPVFEECWDVFSRYDARPHWGKMHPLSADELRDLYPEWEVFADARDELDPDGVFVNDYLRTVLGVDGRS